MSDLNRLFESADGQAILNGQTHVTDRPARFNENNSFSKRMQDLRARLTVVEDAATGAPVCPTCNGAGFLIYDAPFDDPRHGKSVACDDPVCPIMAAQRDNAYRLLLQRAGLPGLYREMTFATFADLPTSDRAGKELAAACCWLFATNDGQRLNLRQAVGLFKPALARHYADLEKSWLVLQGPLGVGKTGLAAAVVNELAVHAVGVVFFRLQELMTEIQSRYGKNDPDDEGENADEVLTRIKNIPVLVIDECNFPGRTASDDKMSIFEKLIRYRAANALPTLLTMNFDQEQFTNYWGKQATDPVFDSAHWVTVEGARLRRHDTAIRGF